MVNGWAVLMCKRSSCRVPIGAGICVQRGRQRHKGNSEVWELVEERVPEVQGVRGVWLAGLGSRVVARRVLSLGEDSREGCRKPGSGVRPGTGCREGQCQTRALGVWRDRNRRGGWEVSWVLVGCMVEMDRMGFSCGWVCAVG